MIFDKSTIENKLAAIKKEAEGLNTPQVLKQCFSFIDLTSLNTTDTKTEIAELTGKVNQFSANFPNIPNVAAICVYPSLVSTVKQRLTVDEVKIASVAASFPSSQTFLDIKLAECKRVLQAGANELDIVLSVGNYLEGDIETVSNEIKQIKQLAEDNHIKVILEAGALPTLEDVYKAARIAINSGADFIKTSTGKISPAATPEAFLIMAETVKEYYSQTGKIIGLKPAGGIATISDALLYYAIVKTTLGGNWLCNKYFRIGTSRLANNILSAIAGANIKYF